MEATLPHCLPLELILEIIRLAVVEHRDTNCVWTLSLSLVSHAVRTCALPLLYETLYIDIRDNGQVVPTVRCNGELYRHRGLSFLRWLMNNDDAPPRQHIKHLIFRYDASFRPDLLGPKLRVVPWPLNHLTVEFVNDARSLWEAGLRPQRVHWTRALSRVARPFKSHTTFFQGINAPTNGRVCVRIILSSMPSSEGSSTEQLLFCKRVVTRELDPRKDFTDITVSDVERGHFIFIDMPHNLFAKSTVVKFAHIIWAALRTTQNGAETSMVILCPQKHGNFAASLRQVLLSSFGAEAVELRKLWIRFERFEEHERLADETYYHAFARAFQGNRSPWDTGVRLLDIDKDKPPRCVCSN